MTKPKRIFVIGHMGAGKSLFAQALANALGYQYIDANPSLERYIGRCLKDILGEQGEAAFHATEADIITRFRDIDHVVVVLEESVIVTENNRQLLSSEFVIYLKVSTQTQLERMKDGRQTLLKVPDMKAFLDQLHKERDHFYEEVASLTVDSVCVDDDVDAVMRGISEG